MRAVLSEENPKMTELKWKQGLIWPVVAVAALMGAPSGCGSGGGGGEVTQRVSTPDVRAIVESVRTQSGVPALAGAYITARDVNDWAVGTREVGKSGADNVVVRNDLFQINSNGKAVTATLAARLVEAGKIQFDATPGRMFPDLAAQMNPQLRDVTLEQLLNHRAGVTPLETLDEINAFGKLSDTGSPRQQRRAFVRDALARAPVSPVGTFKYSNGGYTVAGAMLEAAANEEYAALAQREVFGPLGTTYHAGYPRDVNARQPTGHTDDAPAITPFDARLYSPPALEPAGIASLSTRDFAFFVQMHLKGELGQNTLLRPETMRRLHTALPTGQPNELGDPQRYGFGWEEVTLGGVRTLVHYGSDDTYFSVAIIQPARGVAAYAVTNVGGERGYKAVNEAVTRLLGIPNPFAPPSASAPAPPSASPNAADSATRSR